MDFLEKRTLFWSLTSFSIILAFEFIMSQNANSRATLFFLLALLVGTNLFWFMRESSQQDKIQKEQNLLTESEKLRTGLISELQAQKGDNTDLNRVIDQKIDDIQTKSRSIDSLIRVGKATEEDLKKVRALMANLTKEKNAYLAQINELNQENSKLKGENTLLSQNLSEEKERSQKLTAENSFLYEKIQRGAILASNKTIASAIRFRRNGKEDAVSKSKNVEKIKICFNLLPNSVANHGNKLVHVRIISPDGTTVYDEGSGSGKFSFEGKETLYSFTKTVPYFGNEVEECGYFNKTNFLGPGKYSVELYCEGYRIGSTTFSLD